jgi:hypothetical protein
MKSDVSYLIATLTLIVVRQSKYQLDGSNDLTTRPIPAAQSRYGLAL